MGYRGAFWRRLARLGATRFPVWFLRAAPVALGLAFFVVLRRSRRQTLRNLRLAAGERSLIRAWAGSALVFVRFAQCLAEGMRAGSGGTLGRSVVVRGREQVARAMERREGLIFLTAHVGPWDAVASALAEEGGPPLLLVMAAEGDPGAQSLQDETRKLVRVVRLSGDPLEALPLLEHLESGGIVAIQADRVPTGRPSVRTRLFGAPFALPKGPLQLAALSGAPLVPVFAARLGFGRVRVDVGDFRRLPPRPNADQFRAAADAIARDLEAAIARFPEQWFHFVDPDPDAP